MSQDETPIDRLARKWATVDRSRFWSNLSAGIFLAVMFFVITLTMFDPEGRRPTEIIGDMLF